MLIFAQQCDKLVFIAHATVGKGLAPSVREAAFGTAQMEINMVEYANSSHFPDIRTWFQSGFADGWSKPHPYSGAQINTNLSNCRHIFSFFPWSLRRYHMGMSQGAAVRAARARTSRASRKGSHSPLLFSGCRGWRAGGMGWQTV